MWKGFLAQTILAELQLTGIEPATLVTGLSIVLNNSCQIPVFIRKAEHLAKLRPLSENLNQEESVTKKVYDVKRSDYSDLTPPPHLDL